MSRAAEVSGDDDHVAGLRAGPQEDPVFPYASEGRPRDREDRRFLRVAPDVGEPRHERSGWALALRRLRARGQSEGPASLRRRWPGLSRSAVGHGPDRDDRDDHEDDADQEEDAPEAARRTAGGADRDVAPHFREIVTWTGGAVAPIRDGPGYVGDREIPQDLVREVRRSRIRRVCARVVIVVDEPPVAQAIEGR